VASLVSTYSAVLQLPPAAAQWIGRSRGELVDQSVPAQAVGDQPGDALHGLERHIAGEAIGHDDIHIAGEDVIALHETDVVEATRSEQPVGYLHDLGLLFCDFKPDNVMQSGDSVKLIDLGGVYKADEPASAIFGTTGYQAPEIAQTGPTIASDLYTVARTLAVLCTDFRGYQNAYVSTLPRQGDVPLYARHDSLYRFLERATATNPDDRFQSADEMAAQLLGVLREVVAAQRQEPVAGRSTLFTGELRGDADAPAWTTLPALLVSADDPAAGLLAAI